MSLDSLSVVVVTDVSIKNQIATSISHIHSHDKPVIKTIHHVVNIISTEAKIFTIGCDINQATCLPNVKWIFFIMDSIHAAKRIFDFSSHLYQTQSASISHKLREFFKKGDNNLIEFWDCSSNQKWHLYDIVNKKTKKFSLSPIFSCKLSWDFSRKSKCNNILNSWKKMVFQTSDDKERHFMELLDEDLKLVEPLTANSSLWLILFGCSNSLCARATRVIVNHAPIGEYRLEFFPREEFKCLCGLYSIETRHHILHDCKRYNSYWNPRRDTIAYFTLFLEFNSRAFSFGESIT